MLSLVGTLVILSTVPIAAFASTGPNSPPIGKGTDTDPHIGMSPSILQGSRNKQAISSAFYAANFGPNRTKVSPLCPQLADTTGFTCTPPISKDLVGNQMTQQANTWCAPAAMTEVILGLGVNSVGATMSMSQSSAAALLKTQPYDNDIDDGTAWSGINAAVPNPTQRPMVDVYNYEYFGTTAGSMYQIGVTYLVAAPHYTSADLANYKSNLTWDVYDGYPVIGDAWESPGGYFLVGHPTNIEIFHWFKIRGYYTSGAGTDYEDSESGAEALSGWPVGSVPKYSSYDSGHLLQILGGRGYIW
jgi:peptidase C39-like protein